MSYVTEAQLAGKAKGMHAAPTARTIMSEASQPSPEEKKEEKKIVEELVGKLLGKKKACGCQHKMKGKCTHLAVINKGDVFVPLISLGHAQLPLETQVTEAGGAGSMDIRPTMREASYQSRADSLQRCAGCDHARQGGTVCTALKTTPTVAPRGWCSLWTGPALAKGVSAVYFAANAMPKQGNVQVYKEQTMPDYQYIYGLDEAAQHEQRLRESEVRRRTTARQYTDRYGFWGNPPEPVLAYGETFKEANFVLPKTPTKVQDKPTVQPPRLVVTHPKNRPQRLKPGTLVGKAPTEETAKKKKRRKRRKGHNAPRQRLTLSRASLTTVGTPTPSPEGGRTAPVRGTEHDTSQTWSRW